MKHYVTEQILSKQVRKRKGYLLSIQGSELQGHIVRGWKYISTGDRDNYYSQKPSALRLPFYKKIRVWPCTYCGQESHYMAIFQYSGHDILERICKNCVKLHGPIVAPDSYTQVPICN